MQISFDRVLFKKKRPWSGHAYKAGLKEGTFIPVGLGGGGGS